MSALAGTGALMRLILRRDRLVLPAWVLLLGSIPLVYAASIDSLYPSAAARQALVDSTGRNPATVAVLGPIYDASLGGLTAWRSGFLLVLVGLASALTVVRHTRAEEEAGRRELLGSAATGRQAPLLAALAVTGGADLALAAVTAGGLAGLGLPAIGSIALGLSLACSGWIFAGVAAVAAQLSQGARPARGIALGLLGLGYVVRAAGDAQGSLSSLSRLAWASPFGALARVRAYGEERWGLLAAVAALGLALAAGALALSARRDLGAGLLAVRPGPAAGSPALAGPLGLAWRLQRGTLGAWTVGFAVLGAVIGGATSGLADQVNSTPGLRDLLARIGGGSGLTDSFLAAGMGTVGLVAAGYAVQATLRLRSEEVAQHAEAVLATAVDRRRWMTSHLLFAVLGPAVALAAAGVGAGLSFGLAAGDVGHQLPRVLLGALVQLPAVWVVAGIALALFGLVPRLVGLAWVLLAGFLLLGQLGPLLRLSQVVMDVSPFTHLPKLPGGAVSAPPLLTLAVVAVVLGVAGLAGFRRRDVG